MNPYDTNELLATGPVIAQPQFYWTLPPIVQVRWRAWPPSPQPLQMSAGDPTYAPVRGRVGIGSYATLTPAQPASIPPAFTEGLRAPGQADMLTGGAYALPIY